MRQRRALRQGLRTSPLKKPSLQAGVTGSGDCEIVPKVRGQGEGIRGGKASTAAGPNPTKVVPKSWGVKVLPVLWAEFREQFAPCLDLILEFVSRSPALGISVRATL